MEKGPFLGRKHSRFDFDDEAVVGMGNPEQVDTVAEPEKVCTADDRLLQDRANA